MRRRRLFGAAIALATAAWFAAFLLPLPWAWRVGAIDVLWAVCAAVAGAAALAAAAAPENRPERVSFLFLGAGCFAWTAGEALWTYYELTAGVAPSPSLADVGFISALPLLAAGLVTWPRARRRLRRANAIDGTLLTGVVFLCSFVFILRPILDHPLDGLALLNAAFPLGDVLLLAAVLFGIGTGIVSQSDRILLLVPGFLALVVADTYYALAGDYATGASILDAGWPLAFAAIGACAVIPRDSTRVPPIPSAAAPVVATGLLVAVAAAMISQVRDPWSIDSVPLALVFLLFVLLIVRHLAVAAGLQRRSRALEELRRDLEHEHDIRDAALNASRTGVCILGEDGSLKFRNGAWRTLLHFVEDEPGAVAALVGGLTVDAQAGLRSAGGLRFWTPDGHYLAVGSATLPEGGTLLTVDDLTAQEQERSTRDRFLAGIVSAQDYEARRVAELLHDDVVQRLTALGLRLELTAGRGGDEALVGLAREAGEITSAIRRLLVELHPAVLESQGLSAAVDAAAASLRAVDVDVTVQELDVRLPQETEQLAYRLVQEALSNALKHAQASKVEVRLAVEGRALHCEVVDDGVGFALEEAASAVRRGSFGLQLVRERIAIARGRVEIDSAPGEGTSFRFQLPLRAGTPLGEPPRAEAAA